MPQCGAIVHVSDGLLYDALPVADQAQGRAAKGHSVCLSTPFENSRWSQNYVARIRKMIYRLDNYNLFRSFPHIPRTEYGEEFRDEGDDQSTLRQGTFKWLVSL